MPIRLRDNPYRGVNAHLQSYLQMFSAAWGSFHAEYIVFLRLVLSEQLPDGYYALSENSLQVVEHGSPVIQKTRPDVTVFQQFDRPSDSETPTPFDWPVETVVTLPIIEAIDEFDEDNPPSIVIYQQGTSHDKPVLRIELLSPTNTPGYSGFYAYRQKRYDTLQSGVPVVEVNFLHSCHPTFSGLPDYSAHMQASHPYSVCVIYPVPTLRDGNIYVLPFDVDVPIPILTLPLSDTDTARFDMQSAYQRLFSSQPAYRNRIDYTELPLGFDSYSSADQERIRVRMDIIRREHEEAANADATP